MLSRIHDADVTVLKILVRLMSEPPGLMEPPLFMLQGLCKIPGCDSLVGEGFGRQAAQGCLRSVFVVVAPPFLVRALASASEKNQEVFRHSARKQPLMASM